MRFHEEFEYKQAVAVVSKKYCGYIVQGESAVGKESSARKLFKITGW